MNKSNLLWLMCSAALSLAACGGGGDSASPAPPPVAASDAIPDSASQSAQGMTDWVVALATEDTEAKDPLDAAKFMPPTAEDAEPVTLK